MSRTEACTHWHALCFVPHMPISTVYPHASLVMLVFMALCFPHSSLKNEQIKNACLTSSTPNIQQLAQVLCNFDMNYINISFLLRTTDAQFFTCSPLRHAPSSANSQTWQFGNLTAGSSFPKWSRYSILLPFSNKRDMKMFTNGVTKTNAVSSCIWKKKPAFCFYKYICIKLVN